MSSSKAIKFKDTMAQPGSDLYKHLVSGDAKAAEKSYKETAARHTDLMKSIDEKFSLKKTE